MIGMMYTIGSCVVHVLSTCMPFTITTYIKHDSVLFHIALLAAGAVIPGEHEQAVNGSQCKGKPTAIGDLLVGVCCIWTTLCMCDVY